MLRGDKSKMVATPKPAVYQAPEVHCLSGPPLHHIPVVDRLSRLYLYATVMLRSWTKMVDKVSARGRHAPSQFMQGLSFLAPEYPYIFNTWLRYPEAFEDIDHGAMRAFMDGLPRRVSPWVMERVLDAMCGDAFPAMPRPVHRPEYDWQVLELPGSSGRYASFLSRATRELEVVRNCTVVCRDEGSHIEAPHDRTVAGIYYLLAGAGSESNPNIVERVPERPGGYDLIIGTRQLVDWEEEAALRNRLAPYGELILMDIAPIMIPSAIVEQHL